MEQYIENQPPPFELITENVYLDDTGSSRDKKKAKKMVCECQFDPGMLFERYITLLKLKLILMFWSFAKAKMSYFLYCVEMDDPETACGEDCLNKLLLIEWYKQITLFVYFKVFTKYTNQHDLICGQSFELCVCVF